MAQEISFFLFWQEEARKTIPKMLANLDLGRTEKCVRLNSVSSGLAEADMAVILQADVLPTALMLPKVENTGEVQWVSESWLFKHFKQTVDLKEHSVIIYTLSVEYKRIHRNYTVQWPKKNILKAP